MADVPCLPSARSIPAIDWTRYRDLEALADKLTVRTQPHTELGPIQGSKPHDRSSGDVTVLDDGIPLELTGTDVSAGDLLLLESWHGELDSGDYFTGDVVWRLRFRGIPLDGYWNWLGMPGRCRAPQRIGPFPLYGPGRLSLQVVVGAGTGPQIARGGYRAWWQTPRKWALPGGWGQNL